PNGGDPRKGGHLPRRLDEAEIAPFAANLHDKARYIALSQPMPLLANTAMIGGGAGEWGIFGQSERRSGGEGGAVGGGGRGGG
ncbi:hypothetical protein C9F09_02265, partial [Salmonella enterica subsp. enterica serovar Wilhelmsburg]